MSTHATDNFAVPELHADQGWTVTAPAAGNETPREVFFPAEPESLQAAGLEDHDVEALVLKFLYLRGAQTGYDISKQLKLNISLIEPLLLEMKRRMLIAYRGSALANDYVYQLTSDGMENARQLAARCSYCGAAPIGLEQYRESVTAQSLRSRAPTFNEIKTSMKGLVLSDLLLSQIGQAIHSGRSLLLYGDPGNGKTSIARRAIHAHGDTIWIPRTLTISGEMIRVFDPAVHEEIQPPQSTGFTRDVAVDERWVQIRRPTIVVGGELTLQHLEAIQNETTGIIEAPIYLKSNCGALIVDDFGRQRIRAEKLLNRWIIPLESGQDYLNLPTGRQVNMPFDQLLVFSTNLSPSELCDEAFLRRIQYKVAIPNPTRQQLDELFSYTGKQMGIEIEPESMQHLYDKFYHKHDRPMRFCHAVDLLTHAKDFCEFHREPLRLTREIMDIAANNYFVGQ